MLGNLVFIRMYRELNILLCCSILIVTNMEGFLHQLTFLFSLKHQALQTKNPDEFDLCMQPAHDVTTSKSKYSNGNFEN